MARLIVSRIASSLLTLLLVSILIFLVLITSEWVLRKMYGML